MHQPSAAASAALPTAHALRAAIAHSAQQLGLDAIGVSEVTLSEDERHLERWLERGWHGEMHYMARHGRKRSRPDELVPGTLRVISARMNYRAREARAADAVLGDSASAYISRYALGRDYHKVLRRSLRQLAAAVAALAGPHGYRVFVDSAPVLEKALARNAGLGWIGKHTNLIARDAGSWFFLGEVFTDLPLLGLYSRLSDRRDRGAVSAGCTPLHFLSHHRTGRFDPAAAAGRHGQSYLRLRRLPAGVSVE